MARLWTTTTTDDLSSAHNAALNITADITILLWMKAASLTLPSPAMVAKTNLSAYDFDLYMPSGGQLTFYSDNTSPTTVTGSTIPDITTWHRVAVRRLGTAVDFFLDGVKTAASGAMANSFGARTLPLHLGRDGASNGTVFPGEMAQVRVYNIALTDAEIEAVLRGVPVRWLNCVRAFDLFGVSSPEPDTSIAQAHATVTGTSTTAHPPGLSAVWLAPNEWFHEDVVVGGATLLAQERNVMRRVYGRLFSGVN